MRRRAISKPMEHELECALAPRVVEVERVERAETRLGAPIALRERPERLQPPQPRVAISGHQRQLTRLTCSRRATADAKRDSPPTSVFSST